MGRSTNLQKHEADLLFRESPLHLQAVSYVKQRYCWCRPLWITFPQQQTLDTLLSGSKMTSPVVRHTESPLSLMPHSRARVAVFTQGTQKI